MSDLIQEIVIKKTSKRDKNIKEWNRINNIWLDIKNKNKIENPSLYSTDSESSLENVTLLSPICNNNNNSILKKSNSFCSYDDEISNSVITNNNDFMDGCYDDTILDDYMIHSVITPSSIKYKYTTENAASLEVDYTLNYNMKLLTHIGNYYEILKNKSKNSGTKTTTTTTTTTTKTKTHNRSIKMCKPELIKSIVEYETNVMNHDIVYKCKKMLEYIETIKSDKYFASFVLFP
jgi:hypothetical protein